MEKEPPSQESQPSELIQITSGDAEFYVNRLIRLCVLRQEIDAGNLGFGGHWGTDNAHDPEVYKDKNGNTKVRKRIETLPIYKPKTGRENGLRFGILYAIYGTRNLLEEMGLGREADEIIVFDSTMPGGKQKGGEDGKRK